MSQEIPVLPVVAAGPDVNVNVAKTAKMKTAMTMESVKADVMVHIMEDVVFFLVVLMIVKDVTKRLATAQSALKDGME